MPCQINATTSPCEPLTVDEMPAPHPRKVWEDPSLAKVLLITHTQVFVGALLEIHWPNPCLNLTQHQLSTLDTSLYNHRMVWVRRDLKDHQVPTLCCNRGTTSIIILIRDERRHNRRSSKFGSRGSL